MDLPQLSLFEAPGGLPEGFRYQPDFISIEEEAALVEQLSALPFKEF